MNSNRYIPVGNDVYIDGVGPGPGARRVLVGGLLLCLLVGLGAYQFYVIMAQEVAGGRRGTCRSNLKQLALAMTQYAQDNDQRYPQAAINSAAVTNDLGLPYGWADALLPYFNANTPSTRFLQCPAATDHQKINQSEDATGSGYTDYWFNQNLAAYAVPRMRQPARTLLFGEGNDSTNLATDVTDARYSYSALPDAWLSDPTKPLFRHDGRATYAFADGHAKWLTPGQLIQYLGAQGPSIYFLQVPAK